MRIDGHSWEEIDPARILLGSADFNIVMTGDGRLVEVQGRAEGAPFGWHCVDEVLDPAQRRSSQLLAVQRQVLDT
jgi:ribonuclease PH